MYILKRTLLVILLALFIISILGESISATNGCESWYVKRNGNKQPSLQGEQEIILKYDGYYLDRSVNDDSEKKILYLTFDAGYANESLVSILDTLSKESVPAAFFLLDNIIVKNTDLVTRMTKEGHLVCNHTKNHRNLTSASEEEIFKDLQTLESLYKDKTGLEMSKYFRFPEGKYSESALSAVQKLGYKTIFWSFAYADWDEGSQPSCESAIAKVLNNTHNGAVILLHPTSSTNAKILPKLIKEWRKMGYCFGTLDELVSK